MVFDEWIGYWFGGFFGWVCEIGVDCVGCVWYLGGCVGCVMVEGCEFRCLVDDCCEC